MMRDFPWLRAGMLSLAALVAFAANSVLCKAALATGAITPAAFTAMRLGSGAAALVGLAALRGGGMPWRGGSAGSALALVAYATAFSFGYVALDTGTGALILFAAVQLTMIGGSLLQGHRLAPVQWAGAALAMAGLVWFLSPGATAPAPLGAVLMGASGAAWGIYSMRRQRTGTALSATAGNFALASLVAVPALLLLGEAGAPSATGLLLAAVSGAVTSGLGYAVWYAALELLSPHVAAILQLSVPLIAAVGGMLFLGEALTVRFALAGLVVLGGIVLVIQGRRPARRGASSGAGVQG